MHPARFFLSFLDSGLFLSVRLFLFPLARSFFLSFCSFLSFFRNLDLVFLSFFHYFFFLCFSIASYSICIALCSPNAMQEETVAGVTSGLPHVLLCDWALSNKL